MLAEQVPDARDRRGRRYGMDEAILSVLVMFLLKEGSRNAYNQDRQEPRFCRNIRRLLKINLLHGDSFEDILQQVDPAQLESLRATMVRALVRSGTLRPDGRTGRFTVAYDASGTHSFGRDYCGKCLRKTSKNGAVSYGHSVLEAKLVTAEGFCISLASEWLENGEGDANDKQDCETNAFKRLADRVKKLYPDLPVLVVADGLYATVPVVEKATQHGWDYMLVLKDGSQGGLNEEIGLRPDRKTQAWGLEEASWLGDLQLGEIPVSWLQWREPGTRFCWITNLDIRSPDRARALQGIGRLRWKIENEGFNTQKNLGYAMRHKFSRTSFTALKNYYHCMQVAHLIEQLCLLGQDIRQLVAYAGVSIIKLSERIRNMLVFQNICPKGADQGGCPPPG